MHFGIIPVFFLALNYSLAFKTNFSTSNPYRGVYVAPMDKCGAVECAFPCAGAAPPLACPAHAPRCASGCACMYDCVRRSIQCYQTKHCEMRQKYYARSRKPRMH